MPLVGRVYISWGGYGITGYLLRGLAASICLLPPTLSMGATLPAVARWVETTPRGVSWLGFFYAGNIAGAVFGSLLAGFYLLRVFDMTTATLVAVAFNAAVGGLGLLVASLHAALALALRIPRSLPHRPSRTRKRADGLYGHRAVRVSARWPPKWCGRGFSACCSAPARTPSRSSSRVFLIGLGIGSSLGCAHREEHAAAACGAGMVPVAERGRHCLERAHAPDVAAVLADQRVDFERHLVQLPARFRARVVGRAAGPDSLGRQFSAGARRGGRDAARIPAGWLAASTPRTPSARSSVRWAPASCWCTGSARSTRSRP